MRKLRAKTAVHFQFCDFGCIIDVALGARWTPADLESEVQKRANVLAASGIEPGATVVVAHSGSARFFADLLAVWTRGCAAACIDPSLTRNEIETLVDYVEPSAVLVDEVLIDASVSAPVLRLADAKISTISIGAHPDGSSDPALILFTSGTTGNPKGVVLSFGALLNRFALNRAAMGLASGTTTLVTLPTSFGHGLIGSALTPLLSGSDIVLHPTGLALAQDLGRIVDRHRIGFLSSVPSFWRLALKFSNVPAARTLARVHVGSAPLSAELWAEIVDWSRADVINCYGITELANWVAGASSRTDGIASGLVGKPWGGQAVVKDSAGALRKSGDGELLIQSPSVMSGYLRRPDLTAAVLTDGWYHTGDTGHIDDGGRIRLTGRIKDEINRAGFKVQPAEIDALLETHPAVLEACVFGIADGASGEIVVAAVHLAPGASISTESLRHWCAARVRRENIPERWFVVDSLARNERGKISRDGVRRSLLGEQQ
jgi:acyl-CoA synthetase (AMP-forming)/AMP-acid ligase II